MDILRIDASRGGLSPHSGMPWKHAVDEWLRRAPSGGMVTILVHGFRYAPGHARHDPHALIYARQPPKGRARAISWPQHLGGAVVAFGWEARGSIWRASREARVAGLALAALAGHIGAGGRQVAFVAHSLGARAVLAAMGEMQPGVARSAILMTAAAFAEEAAAAMAAQGGRDCRVLNVTTRENDLFDLMFRLAAARPLAPTVAQGLARPPATWRDLRIDCGDTRRRLARHGWPIRPPAARICHWSAYLRPGLFAIYRAFLAERLTPAKIGALLP